MLASFVVLITFLVSLIIPLAIVYFLYKYLKRSEARAEEKIQIEKQHSINLQKQLDDLNQRLVVVENLLKEVE